MRRAFVRLTAAGTVQDFHLASLSNFPKKILTIKSAAKLQFFFDCSGSVKIFSNQPTIHSKVFFFSSWAARLLAIPKGRGAAHGLLYSLYSISATRRRRAFRLYCACASLGAKPQRSFLRRSLRPSAFRVSAARNAGCNPCRVCSVAKCKKEKTVLLLFVRTRGRDRTGTSVTSSVFETDASTYSATWASVLFQAAKIQLFSMQMQPPSKIFGIIHLSL